VHFAGGRGICLALEPSGVDYKAKIFDERQRKMVTGWMKETYDQFLERIQTTRRLSYAAWSLVGVLGIGAIVSVGWASHKMTRAAVETQHLQRQVTDATAMADTAAGECDDLRRMLADAREEAARTEGKLAAYKEPRPVEPTSRPSLSDRIASIFE